MKLNTLPKSKGIKRKKKRLGSGPGSGTGKTSGKGHKGQRSRSGGSLPETFEGGQMPLHRKLPYKRGRGFTNSKFKKIYAVVNLSDLETLSLEDISINELVEFGLVRANEHSIKVLGSGTITKKINLKVHAISQSAKAKIEASGGSVTILTQ